MKSKKKTLLYNSLLELLHIYLQLCSEIIVYNINTYIINNKLVSIESLFTTELYLKFITVIIPTLSLLNIQIAQTKFNKYNIYIKYFKMLEHLSKWKGET